MSDAEIRAAVTPAPTSYNPYPKPRIYNTSIPVPDEDLDNVPVPYIIVKFDGMTNDQSTKDDYEGDTDTVTVSIEVTATTRKQLAKLMKMIREAVHDYFVNYTPPNDDSEDDMSDEVPIDYLISASEVNYDAWKPCMFQTMTYQCDTYR